MTNSNHHLSSSAHEQVLNAARNRYNDVKLESPKLEAQQNTGKYGMHSKLQEFADVIEYRYKEKADISNEKDESVADSTMTEAEIRHVTVGIYSVAFENMAAFIAGALLVLIIPIFATANSVYYLIAVAAIFWGYFNYFFLYVTTNSRQFVTGPTTQRLYRPMVDSLERFETVMFLISILTVSTAIGMSKFSMFIDTPYVKFFAERLSRIDSGGYIIEVFIFITGNFTLYMLTKNSLYKKYKELARKRMMKIDLETSTAADVARKVLDGDYEKDIL
ncbi:hypothetical protein KKG82_06050 [Patescibacteria group bacterium]|nr:hypothetical protein [Patescibacteria group bacterium]